MSVVLLSVGWLGVSGLTLFVALVPLLRLSEEYGSSWRDMRRMAMWACLTFVLWNVVTVWWIWIATPIGPIAATVVSTFWNMLAFMLYHYISKRAPKPLSYTILAAAWVAAEYLYTYTEVLSFPWLSLGNGFSGDVWAVQWYEYTGTMGGSLWVVLGNIAIFEALRSKSLWPKVRAAMVVGLPMLLSLIVYWSYEPQGERAKVAVIQPNIDCYTEKFNNTAARQLQNILQLISQTPADSEVIVLPETALPESIDDDEPQLAGSVKAIAELVRTQRSQALVAAGATTIKYYEGGERPPFTARAGMGFNYDIFNSAIAINADTQDAIHHKMRLVVGVEAMPRLV